MIILYFFIGFFIYWFLGFLFYYVALGIYAKTGFAEIIAIIWFQSEKIFAMLFWVTFFPIWLLSFIFYFSLKILFFPISFIFDEIKNEDFYCFSIDGAHSRFEDKFSIENEWRQSY